jgi:hypothetical protein
MFIGLCGASTQIGSLPGTTLCTAACVEEAARCWRPQGLFGMFIMFDGISLPAADDRNGSKAA